jgi:hypothetical protein
MFDLKMHRHEEWLRRPAISSKAAALVTCISMDSGEIT